MVFLSDVQNHYFLYGFLSCLSCGLRRDDNHAYQSKEELGAGNQKIIKNDVANLGSFLGHLLIA